MIPVDGIAYTEALVPLSTPAIGILDGLGFTATGTITPVGRTTHVMTREAAAFFLSVPDPGSWGEVYLNERGPGITSLGFWTSDARALYLQALDAGATSIRPPGPAEIGSGTIVSEVQTPLGLSHVFLQAGRPVNLDAAVRFDHAALAIGASHMAKTAAFYEALGLSYLPEDDLVIGDQGLISGVLYSPGGGVKITVVAQDPLREPGQVSGFIDQNGGPGIQHMAVHVPNTINEVITSSGPGRNVRWKDAPLGFYERLVAEGIAPPYLDKLKKARVVYDRDSEGGLDQKFTEPVFGPSWIEYITRHGSMMGFGKGAITALYESAMS